jgi:hypothetical protein
VWRLIAAMILGAVLGAVVTSLVFLTQPRRSRQEQEARSVAAELACASSDVGLGTRPCAPVEEFRKAGAASWRIRFEGPERGRQNCFVLRTFRPPRRVACQ